ncbi:MAG: hypothetical protein IJR23_03310 [Lachnospiraceae bacterium]|nr:hypothetical protein [Lachnospiraceae bacterium]
MKKRLLASVLALALVVSMLAMPASKAEAKSRFFIGAMGHIDENEMFKGMSLEEKASAMGMSVYEATDCATPSKFDLRDYGLVTSVKNQNPYGTCWTFATIGSIESNAIMLGLADSDIDLSEIQMGYFATHIPEVQDDMIQGEGFDAAKNWLDNGGNFYYAMAGLMKGYGPAPEEFYPYKLAKKNWESEDATAHNVFRTAAVEAIAANDKAAIKEYLTKNGALYISLCAASWSDKKFFNEKTSAAYLPAWDKNYTGTDHAILVVGWDDNYSKENFATQPEGDGAWIIKNSWGEEWGDAGYLYVSYYDVALDADHMLAGYKVAPLEYYDYSYQYDGGLGLYYLADVTDVAVNITAKADQTITAVAIKPCNASEDGVFEPAKATVNVYKNLASVEAAATATPIYTQTGYDVITEHYQTLEFKKGVNISEGDKITVIVTFSAPIGYYLDGPIDWGERKAYASALEGETFTRVARDNKWYDNYADADGDDPNSVCLKVFVRNGLDQAVIHRDPNAVTLDEPTFYLLNNEEAKVTVTWKTVEGAEGYKIYRKVKGVEADFSLLATVDAATTKYADTGLTIGQDYIYKVVPFAGSIEGNSAEKTIRATIAAPWITKLENTKKGQVKITIQKVNGAKSYSAYRLIGKTYQYLGNTTKTTYVDTFKKGSYEKGVTYTYKLAVKRGDRTSALSAAKTITTNK